MSKPSIRSAAFLPPASPVHGDPVPDVDFIARLGRPLRVCWEGDLGSLSCDARFNRECCLALLNSGDVELTLSDRGSRFADRGSQAGAERFAPLRARRGAEMAFPLDVTIRHQRLPDWRRPDTGRLIVMAPWARAHVPCEWRHGALRAADEVWAASRSLRDAYVRSGVPAEKVRLLSPGVDLAGFAPEGPAYPVPTRRSVRFLLVGPLSSGRGADLLLSAYQRAFTADDDVCLVIRAGEPPASLLDGDTGLADAYRRAAADPRFPEILLLEEDLSDADLAALYRACTCQVLPYRGVASGLSVLEGMACGLPGIVTAGGATDDWLHDRSGWRLPSRRRPAKDWTVGAYDCAGEAWELEPDREALVATLRHVLAHPDEVRARSRAARAQALAAGTWQNTVAQVRFRLLEVVAPPGDPPFVPARPWEELPPPASLRSLEAQRGAEVRGEEEGEVAKPRNGETAKAREDFSSVSRFRSFVVSRPDPSPLGGLSAALCASSEPSERAVKPSPSQPTAIEISLCMIVRDEEPRLPKCLASVAPFVDEMVIVDTGSTDRTREVARHFGARVFDFPWMNSFALARNQSVELARGRWVLRMDADDLLCAGDGPRLRELIRCHSDRNDVAYLMEYHVPPAPDGTGGHVVDQVQLWPNRPDLRFEYRLHEQLLPAVLRAGMFTVPSGIAIHHCNFDWSEEGQAKRRRRDFPLLEMDLKERPDDPFVLFNLGMTYHNTLQAHEIAAHYLRRSLDCSQGEHGIDRLTYVYLVRARIAQNDWEAALAANQEGRRRFPDDAELQLQAGEIHERLGQLEEARLALEQLVLGCDEPHYRCGSVGLRTFRGRHELALLLRRQGRLHHCEQILREITETYPHYLPARTELVETLRLLGRQDEAEAMLNEGPPAANNCM